MHPRGGALPRVAVFGLGNTLLGDDAVGPRVVDSLEAEGAFPEHVTVQDLGTPVLDLTPYLLDIDAVLFVDAVRMGAAPGTVRVLAREELLEIPLSPRVSPHDPGVQQALQVVELQRGQPLDAAVLGVEPVDMTLGAPLSPAVAAAIPTLKRTALEWVQARFSQSDLPSPEEPHETSR